MWWKDGGSDDSAGEDGDGDDIMENVGDGKVIVVTAGFDSGDGGGDSGSDVNGGGRGVAACTAVIMLCLFL